MVSFAARAFWPLQSSSRHLLCRAYCLRLAFQCHVSLRPATMPAKYRQYHGSSNAAMRRISSFALATKLLASRDIQSLLITPDYHSAGADVTPIAMMESISSRMPSYSQHRSRCSMPRHYRRAACAAYCVISRLRFNIVGGAALYLHLPLDKYCVELQTGSRYRGRRAPGASRA